MSTLPLPALRLLAAIALACLAPTTAPGATYHFSTSGDDANSGLSPAEPKRTLEAALPLMTGGNTLLLRRGDRWYSRNYEWNLSGRSDCTVDAYGEGPKPIVSNLELFVDGWEDAGAGRWRHASLSTDVAACFVAGESKLRVASAALVTDGARYAFVADGGTFFVYVHTGGAAPTLVELLARGAGSVVRASGIARATLRHLDFRGGDWIALRFTAPSAHLTIEDCDITRMRSYGIRFEESADPAALHLAPRVLSCYVDKVHSVAENTSSSPPGDGIGLERAVEGALIRGCTVVDAGHTGIGLGAMTRTHHGVRNCVIELNEVYARNSNYCHAFATGGYEGKCVDNVVRRNYFHSYNVTCHVLGNGTKVYSNVFRNIDVSPTSTKQGWAMDWAPWRTTWEGGDLVACRDNLIAHNTIYDCEESPITITQFSPAVFGPGNVIQNNLIVRWNDLDHLRRPAFAVRAENAAANLPSIRHNGFWKTSAADKVLYLRGATYSANEYGQGNRQQPPAFVNEGGRSPADYRLSDLSAHRTGGLPLTGLGPGFLDYDGHPWDPASPSLGAFQWRPASPAPASPVARLRNVAARATTGPGDRVLVQGFVIAPGGPRTLLLRAAGPALAAAPFNLDGLLADPVLTVYGPASTTCVAARNDNWSMAAGAFSNAGAFPFPAGSRDAAMLVRLAPGAYTAQVAAADDGPAEGLTLLEVYDAEDPAAGNAGRLSNLSVRAHVGSGSGVLIPGVVVGGGSPRRLLIRAVGPTLAAAPFNLTGTLAAPEVTVFHGTVAFASNAGWFTSPDAGEVRAVGGSVGAFPLQDGARDSALLVTVPEGAYTIQVAGVGGATGLALVEVYEVP